MNDSKSSIKTAIIVAIIGLIGTVITVVVNNWDKFSNKTTESHQEVVDENKKDSSRDSNNINNSSQSENINSVDYQSLAETLTNNFLTAFKSKDINSLTSMSSTPYYYDQNILTNLSDVRERFERNFSEKSLNNFPVINSLKVKTVADWRKEGLTEANDRILSSLTIPDDSYLALVTFEHDGLVIVFRKVGNVLKVAGFWD